MEKPWWMKKEPEYDIDADYYRKGAPKNDGTTTVDGVYETYETEDVTEVGITWTEEDAKQVAKANEPLKKLVYSPKTCQDSPSIVDGFKEGRVIVICVEKLEDRENFLRLFDYVMGAVHALDGELVRVDRDTVVLFPYGVDPETNIDELEEAEIEVAEEQEAEK